MVGWSCGFEVACNTRRLADMAWDIARSANEIVRADDVPSTTSGLMSGVHVEPPMSMD